MLSGAVAGGVFASPPPASILAAILSLSQGSATGVLLVVKNYTGDRLNFGLAAEQARAQGVPIDMVIVADDCAFNQPAKAGRRGLCGTVLVQKVTFFGSHHNPCCLSMENNSCNSLPSLHFPLQLAGAMAEEGLPLETIVSRVNAAAKLIGKFHQWINPNILPKSKP